MGCGSSRFSSPAATNWYTRETHNFKWQLQFDVLQLSKEEINQFYHVFRKIDEGKTGFINCFELLEYIGIDDSKFSVLIFGVFDKKNSFELNFRDFVFCLWSYCTVGYLDLFAFDLYDRDADGLLTLSDMHGMLHDFYGDQIDSNRYARELEKKIKFLSQDGIVDTTIFRKFCFDHNQLLHPIFKLQRTIQKKVIGLKFWGKLSKRRFMIAKGHHISLRQFMREQMDQTNFDVFVSSTKGPVIATVPNENIRSVEKVN